MSKTIRVDEAVYRLIVENKRFGETQSQTLKRLLKERSK